MEKITEIIRSDMKESMKAREALKVETLRSIMAGFTNELVAKGRKPQEELSDDEALAVIKKLAKQRKDSSEQFRAGGRPELAEKEDKELEIISAYLPALLPREEIERIAREEKENLGVSDASAQGRLMGAVMKRAEGNADPAVVKEVVGALFS